MKSAPEYPELQKSLTELQAETLKLMSLLVIMGGYIHVLWVTNRVGHAVPVPPSAWVGMGLLLAGPVAGYLLRRRSGLAAHLLTWSLLGASVCVVLTFHSLAATYLFILPVILASVLLSQTAFFLAAAIATGLVFALGPKLTPAPLLSGDILLPATMILLVTVTSWLSARNLHTALHWSWNGYERARRNEEIADQRRGELAQALKALDEAAHRLERTNYMLALARDQAEEARRLKQQFAQTISHELRTPLNLIVGFTELMIHSPEYYGAQLPTAYLHDLSIVYRNACHLQDLVADVLDLARIEAAQMSLTLEEMDPAALVEEAINTVHSLVEAKGLALQTEIEPNLPRLWVDPTRIRQVLINLLNNAVRFTETGSITVRARREGQEIVFAVADTGVGIAPEDIDRIFDEFYRAGNSGRRGGAGLGLAISRQFVKLHGGRIWAESQLGRGSTIYFSLPANREDPSRVDTLVEALSPAAPSALGMEKPVLLVVTRSPSAAALLRRYVPGCRSVVVPDLEQAQSTVQQIMPQAIVIDRACRASPPDLEALGRAWQLPDIPMLLCPLPGEELLRQRLAVDGYLVKPVTRQSLWDALRRFGGDVDRILVIDDDMDFVLFISRMLEDSPVRRYQVISAGSGREGLALMRHYRPDLILLDLIMPDWDGFQTLEHIRADPAWQHIPIIVISAQEEINQQQALAGTVTVAKIGGFKPTEIVRWVQNVMEVASMPRPAPPAPRAAPAL